MDGRPDDGCPDADGIPSNGVLGGDGGGGGGSFLLPWARGFPSLAFAKIAEVSRKEFMLVAPRRQR